jgi:hypothetical protein
MTQEPEEPKDWTWQQAHAAREAVWEARDLLHQLCGEVLMDAGVDLSDTAARGVREALDHANEHLMGLMMVFARTAGPAADEVQAIIDAALHEAEQLHRLDPDNDEKGKS